MCTSIKQKLKMNKGFSLIEMSVVLLLVGAAIAGIAPLYKQKIVQDRFEETKSNVFTVQRAIGSFRAVYGRYPCPSPNNEAPGDAQYGLEECGAALAPGSCANGVCKYASNIPGRNVIVGSLPWKVLNTQEEEVYDLYLNRFTYAVTESLTDGATFDLANGGIGIVDGSGNSMIENVDEAHFIIVMHGQNSFGARSKTGSEIAPCSGAPLVEQENCDANSVFVSIEENTNFDDRVAFFSPVSFAEWQRAAADPTKIHLRATDSVAIGANIANDLSDVEQLTAKSTGAGTGNIRANIAVHASDICMEPIGGATFDPLIHCFSPALIGGALIDSVAVPGEKYSVGGRGISCFEEANPNVEYLVGMQNGIADCVPEVFQSCPRGSYVQGINADFVVQCTRPPEDPCPAMQQTTICGDTGTLPPTDSSQVGLLYSGQCEMITEYDANYFRTTFASMTFAQMQAHIDTLNAEPRTIVDCGASADTALVRDNYMCTDGDWSYLSSHEKTSFYRDFLDASYPAPTRGPHSYWDAEVGGGPDPLNSNHDHDCWCREDYRVLERSYCPDGTTGTVLEVRKRLCPATTYSWGVIYRDYETNCTCVPAEDEPESQTCNSYLDELNDDAIGTASGLTGSVIKYYDTECVDGSPVRTLTSIDTSDCACSVQPDVDTPQSCPEGLTNSWTLPGVGSLTGVETYTRQSWICPATTTTGGLPSPGYLGDPVELGSPPACECASFTDIEAAACPPGQGGQEFYEKEWDCTLNGGMGGFEPQEDWTYLEGQSTCNTCVWAQPPGAGDVGEFPIGNEVSRACSCGVGPSVCYSATGAGYEYWSGCLCEVSP